MNVLDFEFCHNIAKPDIAYKINTVNDISNTVLVHPVSTDFGFDIDYGQLIQFKQSDLCIIRHCCFDKAWIGPCNNLIIITLDKLRTIDSFNHNEFCHEHDHLVCQCGRKAIRECSETFSGFVCGTPVCGTCKHILTEDGVNSTNTNHEPRGNHSYLPWWIRTLCIESKCLKVHDQFDYKCGEMYLSTDCSILNEHIEKRK